MRYENVKDASELNFRVDNYILEGYKSEIRSENYAKLVKDDFSVDVFLILFLLLIIGAIIYWAVKSGKKDVVIVKVEGADTSTMLINSNANDEPYNLWGDPLWIIAVVLWSFIFLFALAVNL